MNRLTSTFAIAATFAASALVTDSAEACGGFFCSQSNPVNQTEENIIFSHNGDGTVTAIIQIQYQGPAERFAWLLPINGVPEVGVSSNIALRNVESRTAPQYNLVRKVIGECLATQNPVFEGVPGAASPELDDSGDAMNADPAPPPVVVEAEGTSGPYDWVVLSVNDAVENKVGVALDWLSENQYDVTGVGEEVLADYMESGTNLLAFKLTKGVNAGAIRPVFLTYESDLPSVPIRPTAVAADPNMGVRTFVLAESQAIPNNYKSLVLNEAVINWFNYRSNYKDVINQAADESGGQGFVTEFAGPTDEFGQLVFTDADQTNWDMLSAGTYADGFEAISAAQVYYRGWDGWRDAIGAAVTLPEGVTLDEFGRSPNTYRDNPELVIDTDLFFESLHSLVVEPVKATQELLDAHPYMTRLYTTMSPDEMDLDPGFDFNPDLLDVNNIHRATQRIYCSKDLYEYEAPFDIEIPGFGVITPDINQPNIWPIGLDDLPATRKIVSIGTSGPGEVVTDNSMAIWDALGSPVIPNLDESTDGKVPIGGVDPMVPQIDDDPNIPMTDEDVDPGKPNPGPMDTLDKPPGSDDPDMGAKSSGGGCAVTTPGQGNLGWLSSLVLGLAFALRGRRRRA